MRRRLGRLVVAPNWIGDAVMSLPVLRALARASPGERLAVLARPGPAAIYRAEGSAGEVRAVSGLVADALAIARDRFAEAWLLPNSFRSALVPFLAAVPDRIGYATDGRAALLTRSLPPPPADAHQLRDYDALLRSRGIEPDAGPPRLLIPAHAAERAEAALARAGMRADSGRFLALAPGAAFSWTKRWPPERFGRLASELAGRGLAVAVAIGPGEEELARRVSDAAAVPPPVLGADLDPVELAAVLARARAVVANDSGPMHLAAAAGTPVIALFGPTDPGRTGPSGSPSVVLDRYVFCSPCYLKECPYRHECLRGIEVGEVVAAVERLLSETVPGRETGNGKRETT
ncbi:MAG TPA: lipopolysaccharide heptosyltransferase II [Thermoanaerobaculia bacterium]|nr:lipopolysaccharide heptosyltransferase II [Thermoanaerobaculia bacterium]